MTMKAHLEVNSVVTGPACGVMDVDLESCHKVINTLMEALQQNFKRDTNYERPLMSPQSNIVFALDHDVPCA